MHPSSLDCPVFVALADVEGDDHRGSAPKAAEPVVVLVVVVARMHMASNFAQHRQRPGERHKRSKL